MVPALGLRTCRVAPDVVGVVVPLAEPGGALATWEVLLEDMRLRYGAAWEGLVGVYGGMERRCRGDLGGAVRMCGMI